MAKRAMVRLCAKIVVKAEDYEGVGVIRRMGVAVATLYVL